MSFVGLGLRAGVREKLTASISSLPPAVLPASPRELKQNCRLFEIVVDQCARPLVMSVYSPCISPWRFQGLSKLWGFKEATTCALPTASSDRLQPRNFLEPNFKPGMTPGLPLIRQLTSRIVQSRFAS
jgi:hypothetical protein